MSSGNLTADRRFDYARALQAEGDHAAAAELLAQALELTPDWPEGRFALAEALANANDTEGATQAYRAYLAVDPADSMGAAPRLALLDGRTPAELPTAYVRRLFDDYAPRFESALRERLKYRAPEQLRAAIDEIAPGCRFAATLDLGCGTGLAGAAFREVSTWLEGVDLSPGMIAVAARKTIYDRLNAADIVAHLRATDRAYDLVIAADVLVYLGDLAPLFAAVAEKTARGALFAFTLQRHAGTDFVLGPEQRYGHSADYVRRIATGFEVLHLAEDVFRQEKGVDVPGFLVVLRKTSV